MKTIFFLLALVPCPWAAFAQKAPDFKPLRFDEDYSGVTDSTYAERWYGRMKRLGLGSNYDFVSFGGHARYQYFYAENEDWGDAPEDHDGYVLSRFLFHADLHLGKRLRFFAQAQSSLAEGRIDPSPVDRNPLELHQGFADFHIEGAHQASFLLRLGRQELSYGSQRLVSVREGPNNRQSFDGVKTVLKISGFRGDLFYTRYVRAADGIFDDRSNTSRQFWGSYLKFPDLPQGSIELYYLGLYRQSVAFGTQTGNETRHSVGLRIARAAKKAGGLRYDMEVVWQTGRFASLDLSAWTASVNAAYRFGSVLLQPEFGVKTEIISGDRNPDDRTVQTFNPLFPRGAYFGLAALVGPSNLADVHPSVSFRLARGLDWTVDYDMFWRYSTRDGLYATNSDMLYAAGDSGEKQIGSQLATDLSWEASPYLSFRAEFTWFRAGRYLKSVSAGSDIYFTGATMQFQF